MGLKGDLSALALTEIFQLITASGKEGTLVVNDDKSRREIYFGKDGIRLLSTGERKGHPLGELLIKKKIITPTQLSQALTTHKTTDIKLGEVFCHLGYIKQDELERIIHNQIENEIYDIFRWANAKFEFIEGPPPTEPLTSDQNPVSILAMDVTSLIAKINKRNQDWESVKDLFDNPNSIFKLADDYEDKLSEVRLTEDEQLVFRVVSGFKTLHDIVEESSLDAFETYMAVHGLKERLVIREISPEEIKNYAKQLLREKKWEQALFFYQQAQKINYADWVVMENIAEILEKLERSAEAGQKYKDLAKILVDKNDANLAVVAYKKALSLLPADEDVHTQLFNLLVLQGQASEASAIGKELIKIHAKSKKVSEILSLAGKIASLGKSDLELRAYLASAYFQMGEYNKSKEEIDNAIKELPSQKTDVLIRAYEKILSIEPRHSDVRYRLDSLRKIQLEQRKKRMRLIMVISAFLVVILAGGIFSLRDYLAYKKFLLVKTEADALKDKGEYESALVKYRSFSHSLTLYSRSLVQKEIKGILLLMGNKDSKIEAAINVELDRLKALYQNGQAMKDRNNNFDAALKIMKDVETQGDQAIKGIQEKVYSMNGSQDITEKQTGNYEQFLKIVKNNINETEKYLKQASDLYAAIKELDKTGRLDEAAKAIRQLVNSYPGANIAKSAKVPVRIESNPSDAEVVINGVRQGRTPLKVYLPVNDSVTINVTKKGFSKYSKDIKYYEQSYLMVVLEKTAKWVFDTGASLETSPLLAGDTAFITTRDGYLKALEAGTGKVKWSFRTDTQTEIYSSPRINNNMVLFGADDNNFYAVRSNAALKTYQVKTANPVRASAFFSEDGNITLIGSTDKNLYAIGRNGVILWKYNADAKIVNAGVVDKQVVYITSDDGMLHAINLVDGVKLWTLALGGKMNTPVVKENILYVGGSTNGVSAVNLLTRKVQWSYRLRQDVIAPLSIAGNILLVPCRDGILSALDIAIQKPVWQFETKNSLSGGVALSMKDGLVYFGGEDGYLYAVTLSTGKELWKYKTKGRIRSTPVIHNDIIYIGSDDGGLHAVEK
ncbi:MAG TPA: PQQ-binding-like beta-propeller repeat protein [Planctomycetota bacterium]|nr:PQQ-binding-like beta-propeller repeat protein [Planctomycetota bacterium]